MSLVATQLALLNGAGAAPDEEALSQLFVTNSLVTSILSSASGAISSHPFSTVLCGQLKTLFLLERLRAWTQTDHARVSKKGKWLLSDPGLIA